MVKKIVKNRRDDIVIWFKKARYGDQCQVVTQGGQTYTYLTKISPGMVKWQVSGFTNRDSEQSKTIRFSELLESWNDFE
jgi:hypothetical protein